MKKRILANRIMMIFTWGLATFGILISCGTKEESAPAPATPDVDFLALHSGSAQVEKRYPGSIEGIVNVDIKAQVSGYLDQIFVQEGGYVQKGQSLFRIKADVFNEQVNSSRAVYEAALAAEQSAKIELEKVRPLVAGKVYTELQLEAAEATYAAAKAQVSQARSALGSSEINADFSLIKAPVSGYIGRIPKRIGNLVTPNDATPMTTLSEINEVNVYFSLTEADFIAFVKDSKTDQGIDAVKFIMADGTTYTHPGRLEIASGNIDRTTGSIAMKATFPNPDKALRSGGAGKVILTRTIADALTIPMASVRDIQDRFFVFSLADSNKVVMKPIDITGKSGNNYIVKSGLKQGEKIALNRIDVLNEGMVVEPTLAADTLKN
ncbi:efflux RND transporter periplasmic adaptor subunit [Sphingobacterium sp. lm-10]|uniref:efflux RND transporter periplasmic adaptor subunit n=1 Tax=Sphingobacterium sp. lm-10 TaxID=2944904 RepID=UPI002020377C|nr:efflux RND transporter periplasmic adaptor subunit [Sphingobacterium sp. lm-10]MCL7989312.1 efflux RND transporter periplasmic adaptor subunit [Sphingobacterium sp. lm-10]